MANELMKADPPGKVQTVGYVHMIAGVLNVLVGLSGLLGAFMFTLGTFGFGFLSCLPPILVTAMGGWEIKSGMAHMSGDHRGLEAPKWLSLAEIISLFFGNCVSGIAGVSTMLLLTDQDVQRYYDKTALQKKP